MTIVDKIKESISVATDLPVYYQSEEQLNRIADNADYPCAYFFLLQTQGITTDSMTLRERVNIAVFFVNLTEFDFNADENEAIIDECKQKAMRWLAMLPRDAYFRLTAVGQSERLYDTFDAQLTGYAVNVTLEELEGFCNG